MTDLLAELKGWQTGIGSFLGLIAILLGALYNAHLNRKRDGRLRSDEALSVAVALYGEILLFRKEAARLARIVSNIEIRASRSIDRYFLEANPVSEPILYKALASKIGMLSPALILAITEFYANFADMRQSLPLLIDNEDRPYSYGSTAVIRPAVDAVRGIEPCLREIERMASIQIAAVEPDLGRSDDLIELEDLRLADLQRS